jgi:hypothetical protein
MILILILDLFVLSKSDLKINNIVGQSARLGRSAETIMNIDRVIEHNV